MSLFFIYGKSRYSLDVGQGYATTEDSLRHKMAQETRDIIESSAKIKDADQPA